MKTSLAHVARLLLVAALTVLSQCGTPWAQAVSPPPIDEKWLPKPALPAPAQPTVQREVCTPLAVGTRPAGTPVAPVDPGLPQAWQLTRGAAQRIAVIDTGVSRHPRLPDVIAGGDYVFTGDGTQDCDAHGTLVAGIIAAAPDSKADGVTGVAPDAALISVRQSSAKFGPLNDRSTTGVGDVDTMAKAVRTAADLGASVINISSVACVPAASALDDRALGAALAYAVDVKNAVVVAPAGNTGGAASCPPQRPDPTWETITVAVSPAWYDDYVLTVGSINTEGKPSPFSLAGPWVDVAAVGEGVVSLDSAPLSGTSYAAPVVSGLAALIRSRFPDLTARQVMQRIEATAHHPRAGRDPFVGNGTIDALAAVSTGAVPQAPQAGLTKPKDVSPPKPAPQRSPDHHARNIAFGGAAVCLAALIAGAAPRLLRSGRANHDGVPGD
ncbi:MAG: type VII secretion-associated serine protease mycosin [Mycobacterium sp.]|uniref:type VII secretion-associated serine protease mycosin n=1 Tax=Mycobacterium sp. TaxID=1785 RepID=UPI001ECC3970|nr:type VII secretion-associated serine protease mycosin [Mycobacterium sp.]MBW0017219.1 type VII secretion-associated serine protease mycosin [Mycobacterium sp.]